ncbi:adenosine deaminase family protein [Piscinibacter sakaiensis]|uniref:adenosine deaminase n=1 Tax=Piscinibacter sakaiensis TaxID=1547922 RepID=A0A0K8P8X2_PISS1|nr:adenosine deaminase family protein [Piscinibacter sakaiensis]GAP38635.1 adenosine deaminase [Piscinibacter sakaiensis]
MSDAAATIDAARALPKVLLHEHLDGGLRVSTLLELLRAARLPAPAADEAALAAWFDANAHAGSLVKYLEGFALTVAAMATPAAMERVAFEAAEDARRDGAVLAEFRIAPLLFEPHGVPGDEAVAALVAGLKRSPLPSGLIVCAMRHLPPEETLRAAELAARHAGHGVVGFDLAGPEHGYPPGEHARALDCAREAGLALTLHAGEADVAERVLEAGRLGARRIGHGTRLADALHDPARRHLVDEVRALGLHLEQCPTSNVHTGAAPSIAEHPITALWRAGLSLSYHTDNRLISCIDQAGEAAALLAHTPLTEADLLAMAVQAARASFLPVAQRAAAEAAIRAGALARGLALSGTPGGT